MGNFRFDELMKDLGLPEERRRAHAVPAEPSQTSIERPDLAGSGLGEVEQVTPEGAPPLIRPDEALSELWTPEESGQLLGDLSMYVIDRGYATNEQLESARRMEAQSPGITLAALLIDSGAEEEGNPIRGRRACTTSIRAGGCDER